MQRRAWPAPLDDGGGGPLEGDSSQFDFFAGESVLFCLPHGVRSATYPFHLISDGPVAGDTSPPRPVEQSKGREVWTDRCQPWQGERVIFLASCIRKMYVLTNSVVARKTFHSLTGP